MKKSLTVYEADYFFEKKNQFRQGMENSVFRLVSHFPYGISYIKQKLGKSNVFLVGVPTFLLKKKIVENIAKLYNQ